MMLEQTAEACSPKILLLGDAHAGKDGILQNLGVKDSNTLVLDTKYYTANAEILAPAESPPERILEQHWEAVILAFDIEKESSFDFVKAFESSLDIEGISIVVCLANCGGYLPDDEKPLRPDWLDKAINWCNERLIEYIEVATGHPEADLKLQQGEEQQGIPRLRAALEAHMWPGMTLKDSRKDSPGEGAGARHQVAKTGISRDADNASHTLRLDIAEENAGVNKSAEQEMENLEFLMNDFNTARQRLQALPDEERREGAGALVTHLLKELGLEADNSSESGSEC